MPKFSTIFEDIIQVKREIVFAEKKLEEYRKELLQKDLKQSVRRMLELDIIRFNKKMEEQIKTLKELEESYGRTNTEVHQ